jgi:hypothetical protein
MSHTRPTPFRLKAQNIYFSLAVSKRALTDAESKAC